MKSKNTEQLQQAQLSFSIESPTDNGNIIAVNTSDPKHIDLMIRGDKNHPEFFQWFNFYLNFSGGSTEYNLTIKNAGQAKYPGWNKYAPYQTYASYGKDEWFTVPTTYDEKTGELTFKFQPNNEHGRVQFAFFPPYSYAKHLKLIESAKKIPHCEISSLGKTNGVEGRDITLLTFGTPAAHKKEIWIIARQHPGEPQAEWYAEELIQQLGKSDPKLFEQYTFRVVPNMNPDGTYDGNLRTNKEGKDLNRMWQTPTMAESPEVFLVLEKMKQTGVDFFMDVHSDEIIPKAFLDEAHLSCPGINKSLEQAENFFKNLYIKMNPDMQDELNYGEKTREESNLKLAAMQVGNRFQCPAFTLEMPTKEWSANKCQDLAKNFLNIMTCFFDKTAKKKTCYSFLMSVFAHPTAMKVASAVVFTACLLTLGVTMTSIMSLAITSMIATTGLFASVHLFRRAQALEKENGAVEALSKPM